MMAILSYPRSGNHFVRYIIEHLSGRPTLGTLETTMDTPIYRRKGVKFLGHVKKGNPCARKYHRTNKGIKPRQRKRLRNSRELILIQRNPCRALLSQKPRAPLPLPKALLREHNAWHTSILQFYENFPRKKICIYFEDLVYHQPHEEIKKIGNFINASDESIANFLTNIEKYTRDSKSSPTAIRGKTRQALPGTKHSPPTPRK